MIDPIKKAIFGYADLGKKEDSLGVKAIEQYNQLLDTVDRQAKAINAAIKKLDGPGMPDRAREAIQILTKATNED